MRDKNTVYTIATAHLDTSWLWTLEQTIEEYIPDTLKRNFDFFEKYPEYKFNFEGSIRYEFIKEYYPEKFEQLKKHIADGRWHPCGACYENGDVNIPSPEALIRNILYGKDFFRKEFGIESEDIFLPDCFGFGKTLPTVAAHSGIKGFSTGKLMWGSSVDIPFDIGVWKGIDDSSIWAALMPFAYTTAFKNIRNSSRINEKLNNSKINNLPPFTFVYHGTGDRGGAPHKSSVKNVINAQRTNDSNDTQVLSVTTKEFFDMLDNLDDRSKTVMPEYKGEFLLTAHGAGSYTSRTVTKRWNRRCELLADAAERFASAAYSAGLSEYPQYELDNAWKKVIAHHFHDDITGTSFEECYIRSHNEYIQAMNTFSAEYTAAVKALSTELDTSFCKGTPVIVANPVQSRNKRTEAVTLTVNSNTTDICIYDSYGKPVPCQVKRISADTIEAIFIAEVASNGLSVYDLCFDEYRSFDTGLIVTSDSLENNYISLRLDTNGDICSIYDKALHKELLSSPVKLQLLNNIHSVDWPAWEIKYEDCIQKPYLSLGTPTIRIIDNGPALASLEITRCAGKSLFRQIISLDCTGSLVKITNETDWREEATLLKAAFSVTANNKYASYDTGCGATKRPTNTERLYEVPAQKWADITDESNTFGITVFSDSRSGWDKPDDSTLRLTLIHTPMVNYRWECSQHLMDMGLNRYSFGIMGHNGDYRDSTVYADNFCQPMHTFITSKHKGKYGKAFSFAKITNDNVRITAIKKAQNSDNIVFRVSECSGYDQKGIQVQFNFPVKKAYEIKGDETIICDTALYDGKLNFDIGHNSIKSFSLEFEKVDTNVGISTKIDLNFNSTGITKDNNKSASTLKNSVSIPYELIPDKFIFAGTEFAFSDNSLNSLACDGSKISVPEAHTVLHLLCASLDGDKQVSFINNDKATERLIPDYTQALGHWDMMQMKKTGYIKPIPQAISFSHLHTRNGNSIAKQFYLFDIEIPVGESNEVTLPDDDSIVIFAASTTSNVLPLKSTSPHFDRLEKRTFDYEFSSYASKNMQPNLAERILDKFINRTYSIFFKIDDFYNKYAFNELYYILRTLNTKLHYKKLTQNLLNNRKKTDN